MKTLMAFILLVVIVGIFSIGVREKTIKEDNNRTCYESKIDSISNILEEERKTNQMLYNYINWKECIDKSEGADKECTECDSLYNPNNEFVYPD